MNEKRDENVDRRGFLKAMAATAAAATVTGVGAAMLGQNTQKATNTALSAVPQTSSAAIMPATQNGPELAALRAQLAAAQTENARLQAALAASEHELSLYRQADSSSQSTTEALQLELQSANQRVTALAGLVALYEQLEGINLVDTVNSGLAALSSRLADLMSETPTLAEGIAAGRVALADLEGHIPLLQNGRIWLNQHLERLSGFYEGARRLLEEGAERLGSFLDMLNNWFQEVRKWLPFNMGQRAADIMEALSRVLAEVPHTLSGLDTNIAQPLDEWLARDGEETTRLQRKLVQPLRARVLSKGEQVVNQAEQLQETYQAHLSQPWETAVEQRQAIRQLIADYRNEHQV
jgi:chromosome segregation ATPase